MEDKTFHLLDVVQAADRLGIKPPSLRKFIFQRRIDVVRIGGKVLIPEEAIERMIQKGYSPAKEDEDHAKN